ncbi:MAG: PAS-domain containing protein [Alphaproteobacteria bacterium]|nr:PAS-domain containing protein [Alphaproteobacteria bacterium]
MNFLKTLTGADQLQEEKNRLEAFLAAFPGEYCGFSEDNAVAYSKNFCDLLGLSSIKTIHDIQNALGASEAAVLEGLFIDLKENNKSFSENFLTIDEKTTLRLSGTIGSAMEGGDKFHIIWAENITEQAGQLKSLENRRDTAESESMRLQKILDTTPVPLWMRDETTKLIWCNQAYADLVDETPATVLVKQSELSLSSKTSPQSLKDIAYKALEEGSAQSTKSHIVAIGKRYLMEFFEIPLSGTGWSVGMAQDLTQSEQQETELKRYLSANHTLLEQLRSAVAIYGSDRRLEFYNTSFSSLWDLDGQWLNAKPLLGDILEKLRETRHLPEQADFKSYKQGWIDMFTNLIDPHEDMMYLPNNTAVRFMVIPHPMGGLMMIFEDVTSRLELESSYNTLVAVQKETLDNLAEGVAVFGGDGRLKLHNPSYADLWGLNPEDLENEPHITKIVDRMKPYFPKDNWEDQKNELITQAIDRSIREGRLERTDDILLDYTTVPLPDGGVLISYFDVTDTVKVEKALRDRNAALEAAEELKTDFLANVSYQLRTPLNAIIGFAEILDNQYFGDLNDKQKEYTGDILSAGNKLVRLIDDILDLSTIEAGYLDLVGNNVDVHDMLSNLQELTTDWARKQNLEIKLACCTKVKSITADESRIKQVMLNLIRNAISFTPEGGVITIGAEKQDEYIKLYVSDTGIGISEADQKRIFDPFERTHKERIDMSPTALEKGAGLGLSIVKNITELHNGYVEIASEEGKGTTFNIFLPLESELEPVF